MKVGVVGNPRYHDLKAVLEHVAEQAPRVEQLELYGLTAAGIARRITALQHEESLEAR